MHMRPSSHASLDSALYAASHVFNVVHTLIHIVRHQIVVVACL